MPKLYNRRVMKIEDYKPGMIVYGKITGIQAYGAFVSFAGDVKGLIHISELSERYVRDVKHFVSIGDYVFVKVIDVDIEHRQLRLSLKALDHTLRKARRHVVFDGMPKHKKGFSSLQDRLPIWVKESKEKICD